MRCQQRTPTPVSLPTPEILNHPGQKGQTPPTRSPCRSLLQCQKWRPCNHAWDDEDKCSFCARLQWFADFWGFNTVHQHLVGRNHRLALCNVRVRLCDFLLKRINLNQQKLFGYLHLHHGHQEERRSRIRHARNLAVRRGRGATQSCNHCSGKVEQVGHRARVAV